MYIVFAIAVLFVVVIITVCIFIFLILNVFDSIRFRVPYVKTRKRIITQVIETLNLNDSSILIDLGCGNAEILIAAKKQHPNITALGYEKGVLPFIYALIYTRNKSISVKYKNIFEAELTQATHIYVYLSNDMLALLEKKIIKECAPGTVIVSCDFTFPNLAPYKTVSTAEAGDPLGKMLYFYIIE